MGRRKWILVSIGFPVLVALWWAFRPEKFWINDKVNETAPFETSNDPQPILTGRFEEKSHQTSGRATIYKQPGGDEYLRLTDFATMSGEDVRVVLARNHDQIDLGPLKSKQGDQNYVLPAATDLGKYDAVVINSELSHTVLGVAKLEPF